MPTPRFRKTLSSRSKRTARLFNRRTGKLLKHQPRLTPITEEYNNQNHSPIVHRTRRRRLSPIPPMPVSHPVLKHSVNNKGITFKRN
jgi:hypothetical protein